VDLESESGSDNDYGNEHEHPPLRRRRRTGKHDLMEASGVGSLLVNTGIDAGRRYSLGERTKLGRAADNEVVLTDTLASRYHAEIVREGIHFQLRDLGSKNGVRVNGVAAVDHRLRLGDLVQIGESTFTFEPAKDFKTARFSDIVVLLEPEKSSSIQVFDGAALPKLAESPSVELIEHAGRLLESQSEELPEVLQEILERLMNQFQAEAGSILLRARSGEAVPLVAVAKGGELRMQGEAVGVVLNEGKALLTDTLTGGDERRHPSRTMLAPLSRQRRVFGALHLERTAGEAFTAEDLSLFCAVARLVGGAVRMAIQMDQMALASPAGGNEPLYIGVSQQAEAVRERIRKVAASDATVLLTGETGTGKELVARSIHAAGPRARRPMVAIDCSSIPANLMESELFGYEAGAFTGADRLKRGKIEMAEGGTLFLDEIGEMQADLQPKLLRFLEDLQFYRVGGTRLIHADVRIVAATNRNLRKAVGAGRFREDLLFRLNVMPMHLPPLRQRREDVRVLVDHFAPRLASRLGKPYLGLVDDAWALLDRYHWPGNVRELKHGLERALILSDDGHLCPEHFQLFLTDTGAGDASTGGRERRQLETVKDAKGARGGPKPASLEEAEAEAIERALRHAKGNRVKAAEILNIHRNTLTRKLRQLKLGEAGEAGEAGDEE
jgi:Nif-specific regulatory protein